MNNHGAKLNQLSKLMFDHAAKVYYSGILLEIGAGVIAITANQYSSTQPAGLVFAIAGAITFIFAYILKLNASGNYDSAETMRRQSVFSEALGWKMSKVQFSEWKTQAPSAIMKKLNESERDKKYYDTKREIGPRRLLEMTSESAFYTRILYHKMFYIYAFIALSSVGIVIFILTVILPLQVISAQSQLIIAYVIYTTIPTIISFDFIGMSFNLHQSKARILEIERSIERELKNKRIQSEKALRLVNEYNCQLTTGIPIHNFIFSLFQKEIQHQWESKSEY